MALISSKTIQYSRLAFIGYVSYLLATSPKSVLEYSGVLVLSTAMNLPILLVNESSPVYGSLAVLLVFGSIGDLFALLDENFSYFELVVPLKLFTYFLLAFYCYLGSNLFLCNSLIFAYVFVEIWFHILIFSSLREEREERAKKEYQEHHDKEHKELDEIVEVTAEEEAEDEKTRKENEQELKKIIKNLS
ncbi:hypothetical protein CANARDRAFT_195592 [[Candida] arabinofermentans NRRL YB-2248]|uniref:Protein ILM1 n=1 Tax=[Candida] arabinofermentans NRRL YB-2248 TaxID=983967 RepID=A0A1E4T508_9ASCO|nr:hypothetical protein CANARDRAFT_195592 [[Candida] arabinofermentans NRRL YB-2248]